MPVAMAYLVSTLGNAPGPGINAFNNRIQLPAGAPQGRVTSKHALYITLQSGSKLCLLTIHKEVVEFITEHIIHRFVIPQTLTMDQGASFVSTEVHEFVESYKIKFLNSSPFMLSPIVKPSLVTRS